MLLSTFWDVLAAGFIIFFIVVPLVLLWVYALGDLFRRRDIKWRKVLWLLGIIMFPFFGPLIYLLVRPDEFEAVGYEPTTRAAPTETEEPHYRPS